LCILRESDAEGLQLLNSPFPFSGSPNPLDKSNRCYFKKSKNDNAKDGKGRMGCMTDAETSGQLVQIMRYGGATELVTRALRTAQRELFEVGFEFASGPVRKPQLTIETLTTGPRLKGSIVMTDPTKGGAIEVRAYLFAHCHEDLRGLVTSWLVAVAADSVDVAAITAANSGEDADDIPVTPLNWAVDRSLARHELFSFKEPDEPVLDADFKEMLTARLSGTLLTYGHFEAKAKDFVQKLETSLSA
jgi:hypothetical protein